MATKDRWEESDIDSDLAESLYNESEAEEDFVPCNDPLRSTSRYSETRPEPVVLSARPSSVASTVGFRNTGGAASSTDIVLQLHHLIVKPKSSRSRSRCNRCHLRHRST